MLGDFQRNRALDTEVAAEQQTTKKLGDKLSLWIAW